MQRSASLFVLDMEPHSPSSPHPAALPALVTAAPEDPSSLPPAEVAVVDVAPADAHDVEPPAPGTTAVRVLGWAMRGAAGALGVAAAAGVAAVVLVLLGRIPTVVAHAVEQESLDAVVSTAALAMVFSSARAGAVERRRRIERERFRIAAERAHREAYRVRQAARAAQRVVVERDAALAAERAQRSAEEQAAAEARAAAAPAQTEADLEAILERARVDRLRREEEQRIETAIRNGTRAA